MASYYTFLRSVKSWEDFSSARKITVDTGLTYDEARDRCQAYNANRTRRQINKGTKMEFTEK